MHATRVQGPRASGARLAVKRLESQRRPVEPDGKKVGEERQRRHVYRGGRKNARYCFGRAGDGCGGAAGDAGGAMRVAAGSLVMGVLGRLVCVGVGCRGDAVVVPEPHAQAGAHGRDALYGHCKRDAQDEQQASQPLYHGSKFTAAGRSTRARL